MWWNITGAGGAKFRTIAAAQPRLARKPAVFYSTPTTRSSSRHCGEHRERMGSIAWAMRIATLTAITITSSQVITFVQAWS